MSYPGGKTKTFHQVVNLMPPHHIYIEPFLGAAAVLRAKRPSMRDIGIEIDPDVCVRLKSQHPTLEVINCDGFSFLEAFPFTGSEFVYCDPPYLTHTRRRKRIYKHDFTDEDHIKLLRLIRQMSARVLISGYASDLYNDELSSWNRHRYFAKTHQGLREEFLWYNYSRPSALHDYRYLGANFRERQTIQRRLRRLKNRLNAITPQERSLIAEWLHSGGGDAG